MDKIFINKDNKFLKEYILGKSLVSIGRSQDNDIVLDSGTISRKHTEIKKEGNKYIVVDLGSLNGTLVNGKKVNQQELNDGDMIAIEDYILVCYIERPKEHLEEEKTHIQQTPEEKEKTKISTHRIKEDLPKDWQEDKFPTKILQKPSEPHPQPQIQEEPVPVTQIFKTPVTGEPVKLSEPIRISEIDGAYEIELEEEMVSMPEHKLKLTNTIKIGVMVIAVCIVILCFALISKKHYSEISVELAPSDAQVYIDDIKMPAIGSGKLRKLVFGKHKVTVKHNSYNEDLTIEIETSKEQKIVNIIANPEGILKK